jgi:hypothetical protein
VYEKKAVEIEVVGDTQEIKGILNSHKEALITEVITRRENRVHNIDEISGFDFKECSYSDFSLNVKNGYSSSMVTSSGNKEKSYGYLANIIGENDANKIETIINDLKSEIK